MNQRPFLALALSLALCLIVLAAMAYVAGAPAQAQETTRYVAVTGTDSGDCTDPENPCRTVQYAVDAADDGDVVKVATGVYTDVHLRPPPSGYDNPPVSGMVTQTVYLTKSLILRGGYTAPDYADPPDPEANPTTLDAQEQGRVFLIAGAISPTVEGLRITRGDADLLGGSPSGDSGGGVLVLDARLTLSNSQVISSAAVFGAGLYFYNGAESTLVDNLVRGNVAWTQTGGIYLRDSRGVILINNTIVDNEAHHIGPGGKRYGGMQVLDSNDVVLVSNVVSGNRADNECGGVCIRSSNNAQLIGNIIAHNHAGSQGFGGNGGGLLFTTSNNVELIGNTIWENSAYGNGGGLYLERSTIDLVNNIFAGNQLLPLPDSAGDGSGLYLAGGSQRLLHTTIAGNNGGDGSGIYVTDIFGTFSTTALTNTIIAGHTVGVTATAGNSAVLDGVLWWDNVANTGGDGDITISGEYTGTPAFVDPEAGDYHIGPGSAAVDRGRNTEVAEDIDGEPRPMGWSPDHGADELPIRLDVAKQATPDPVQAGAQLTYTLRVTNTGQVSLTAIITDRLPERVQPTGVLTWMPPPIVPDDIWMETIVVTVEEGCGGPLVNRVEVTTEEGATGNATSTVAVRPMCVYLPLVLKND
jgi:uncharacterized repeat protein (TIGR01451 family)